MRVWRRLKARAGRTGVRTQLLLLVMALGVPFLVYMAGSLAVNLETERDHALLRRADAALYEAKRLGRDRCEVVGIDRPDTASLPPT